MCGKCQNFLKYIGSEIFACVITFISPCVHKSYTMGKLTVFAPVVIITHLYVYQSYATCSDGLDDAVEGAYGQAINLSCTASNSLPCNRIHWQNSTSNNVVLTADTDRTSISILGRTSILHISRLTPYDVGTYTCWCYLADRTSSSSLCSVALTTTCQAKLLVNGETSFHSSSYLTHYVSVTVGEKLKIRCPEGGRSESNCHNVRPRESGEFTYRFRVLSNHNSCHIGCRLSSEDKGSCSVNFTLNVNVLETSTEHSTTSTMASNVSSAEHWRNLNTFTIIPSNISISANAHTTMPIVQQMLKDNAIPGKYGSFPLMLLTGISIVVFVGILSIICIFIYFSRSKSTSRPMKTQIPGNESPDTNIPIGHTYVTLNKSPSVCLKDDDDSERGIPCTDDAYAELNCAMKEESSSIQQVNAVKAETPITEDYYSVLNTSNTKLEPMDNGNESDSALYTEVSRGVKQAGGKIGTSSPESSDCNSNVPDVQSYDVLEELESSEYDTVGVVSTSPALYAVIDKETEK